jgi:hypothetical protein
VDFYLDLQPICPAEARDIFGINTAGSGNNASFSGCSGALKQDPERFPAGCCRNAAGEKNAARRVQALFTVTWLAVYASACSLPGYRAGQASQTGFAGS